MFSAGPTSAGCGHSRAPPGRQGRARGQQWGEPGSTGHAAAEAGKLAPGIAHSTKVGNSLMVKKCLTRSPSFAAIYLA